LAPRDATGELRALTYADEWAQENLLELRKINASLLILRLLWAGRLKEAEALAAQEKPVEVKT
jgi:hypothetical protein